MKNNRKQNNNSLDEKLITAFNEFYGTCEEANKAMSDARKAFTYIRQDKLHKDFFSNEG